MDDRKIIELYFARDEQAIKETEAKYGKLLHSIADNILNTREDAEECVNDTYLGLWNAIPPTKPDNFMAFISRIVRNLSLKRLDYLNRDKRSAELTAKDDYAVAVINTSNVEPVTQDTDNVEKPIETDNATAIEPPDDKISSTDNIINDYDIVQFTTFFLEGNNKVIYYPIKSASSLKRWGLIIGESDIIFSEYLLPEECVEIEVQNDAGMKLYSITDKELIMEACSLLSGCGRVSQDETQRRLTQAWYEAYGNDNIYFDEDRHLILYKQTDENHLYPDDNEMEAAQKLWSEGEYCFTIRNKYGFGVFFDFFPAMKGFQCVDGYFDLSDESIQRLSEILEKGDK